MFGHDNDAPAQPAGSEPTPDAALTNDTPVAPAGPPAAPADDDLGGYIADDVPTTAKPTDDSDDTVVEPSTPGPALRPSTDPDQLINIKQQALQQLSPLLGHLNQTPEEKFRTTMMMIQAADNDALIKDAYEAAQKITDEKVRAQALLDIVNEINYFTQHTES